MGWAIVSLYEISHYESLNLNLWDKRLNITQMGEISCTEAINKPEHMNSLNAGTDSIDRKWLLCCCSCGFFSSLGDLLPVWYN